MPSFSQKVPDDFSGTERIDKYIASLPNGFNRSKLKSGIQEILVNGNKSKLSGKIRAGDQIEIQWEDNVPDNIEPENIPLRIIFENDDVCVVNKEQGIVTHPAAGNWNGTLVNALLFHFGMDAIKQTKEGSEQEIQECRRPGIVHRLDKDTSGVIITAKHRDAEEYLSQEFKNRNVQKEYVLIVRGCPPKRDGVIDTLIVRDGADRKRFKAVDENAAKNLRFGEDVERFERRNLPQGKRAVTLYHVVAIYSNYTLIRARLLTGRTHQIRVHMKYLGCPVLGDPIYSKKDSLFPDAQMMLHSRLLKIRLPGEENFAIFKAAIPERFKKTIAILKEKFPREYGSKGIKAKERNPETL